VLDDKGVIVKTTLAGPGMSMKKKMAWKAILIFFESTSWAFVRQPLTVESLLPMAFKKCCRVRFWSLLSNISAIHQAGASGLIFGYFPFLGQLSSLNLLLASHEVEVAARSQTGKRNQEVVDVLGG